MEATSYLLEDQVESDHWWFRGRRVLFGRLLRRLGIKPDSRVLDAGTSSGSNLRLLRDLNFTNYRGIEISDEAIAICRRKGLGPVEHGDICNIPFEGQSFDFVFATDVIEHVERDDAALAEVRRVLAPGGYCLLTVPAFPSLWGHQDVVSHHLRRYRAAKVLALVREAGLTPVSWYHFNYLLFLPIWCARQLLNLLSPRPQSENRLNTPLINAVLQAVFLFDILTAPVLKLGFGVSFLVICQRPAADQEPIR